MKPAREPASSRPKLCASLKKPHESCPFAAPCGPRRKKNDFGQRSASPSETSRFALSILAHRGSALPWLVNDQAALRLRRIWSTMVREPARARLLWAILSSVPPLTFGHNINTAHRSPVLTFSAAIHFAMKRSAPCSTVLHHSPSSWAAVIHWSALIPKALRPSSRHTIHSLKLRNMSVFNKSKTKTTKKKQ